MEPPLSKNSAVNTVVSNPEDKPLDTVITPHGQPTEASEEIAGSHWHQLHSTNLMYNGQPGNANALKMTRVFTAPEGNSHRRKQGFGTVCWADIEADSPPVVAKLREHNLSFNGVKAVLKIDAFVPHMLDLIVLTYAFGQGGQETESGGG